MGRAFSEQTLVELSLMHVNTAGDSPAVVVAALSSVNHNEQLIQRH